MGGSHGCDQDLSRRLALNTDIQSENPFAVIIMEEDKDMPK